MQSATTPATPFDMSVGFVGECASDGQHTRVSAIAIDPTATLGELVLLSVVGYEASVKAAFGKLLKGQQIGFLANATAVAEHCPEWNATSTRRSAAMSYWMWNTSLRRTKEQHGMLVPHTMSIAWGQQNPPIKFVFDQDNDSNGGIQKYFFSPRYIVAGIDEAYPPLHRFFGHLRGLRVVMAPTVPWVEYLWHTGMERSFLEPIPALGVRVWRINGDPNIWNKLSTEGIQNRAFPVNAPTDTDKRLLGVSV